MQLLGDIECAEGKHGFPGAHVQGVLIPTEQQGRVVEDVGLVEPLQRHLWGRRGGGVLRPTLRTCSPLSARPCPQGRGINALSRATKRMGPEPLWPDFLSCSPECSVTSQQCDLVTLQDTTGHTPRAAERGTSYQAPVHAW